MDADEVIQEFERVSANWTTQWIPPTEEELRKIGVQRFLKNIHRRLNTAPYRQSNVSVAELSAILDSAFRHCGNKRKVFLDKYFSGVQDDVGDHTEHLAVLPYEPEWTEEHGFQYGDGYHPEREEPLGIELHPKSKENGEPNHYFVRPIPPDELARLPEKLYHCSLLWHDTTWKHFVSYTGMDYRRFRDDFRRIAREGEKVGSGSLERMKKTFQSGVWGRTDERSATYLQHPDLELVTAKCGPTGAFDHPKDHREPAIRLHVDTQTLRDMRTLFYDPEAVFIGEEFQKTFMVTGGIPFEAITDFDLCPTYFRGEE